MLEVMKSSYRAAAAAAALAVPRRLSYQPVVHSSCGQTPSGGMEDPQQQQ